MTSPLSELPLPELAKKTLDNDDEEPTQAYMDALQKFRNQNPLDLNFIVELGKIGKCVGGNGFGTATCMEDYCWTDVMLDADPELPDGGKNEGIGSLFNYQEHCKDPEHMRGRTQRLEKEANAAPVVAPKIFETMDRHHQAPSERPSSSMLSRGKENQGVPRTGSSSSSHSFMPERALHTLSSNIQVKSEHDRKGKGKEVKPTLAQLAAVSGPRGTFDSPLLISDGESEDEVFELSESQIPDEFKKKSNKDCPIVLEDDNDVPAPSRPTAPLAEIFTRPSSSQAPRSVTRPSWATATSQSTPQKQQSTAQPDVAQEFTTSVDAITRATLHNDPTSASTILGAGQNTLAAIVQPFTGDIYGLLDKSASYCMAKWEKKFLDSEPIKRWISLSPFRTGEVEFRQVVCHICLSTKGKTPYRPPPESLLNIIPGYRTSLGTWERSIRAYLGKKTTTPNGGQASTCANIASGSNLTMPGQFPSASSIGSSPLAGSSAGPSDSDGQDGDHFASHMDYGYEMDRPQTTEGLTQLFQTAFEDCADDIKVEEAMQGLSLKSLEDLLPGLECRLMPHQVIGVHWMVKQERKRGAAGGILGDEMGLGKTVQAIGAMVKNPSTIPRVKATLVIVPTALLEQWKTEIESKSSWSAMIYHGSKRTKSLNALKNAEVVITSYGTMTGERPQSVDDAKQKKKKNRKQPGDAGYDSFVSDDEKEFERPRKTGLLFQMDWYRVILDEAAVIRNKNTIASKAVMELKSRINWCLTGTLIYNKLDDIFPYLRFVGVINWDDFREKVSRPAPRKPRLASKRAQALLKPVMLRRTKESELDGKKILQLPPKTVEIVQLEFSPEERAVYASVEQRARVRVNKYLRAGTILKHYHVILVMLMRLRQLCCHPWLLRAKGNQVSPDGLDLTVTDDDIFGDLDGAKVDDESEHGRAVALQGQAWVDKLADTLKTRHEAMSDNLPPATQARAGDDENDYNCPVCFEPYTDEVITACQHSFCAQCIEDVINRPENDHRATEDQMNRRACLCPLCRAEITKQRLFRAAAFHKPHEEDGDDSEVEDDELIDVKPGSSSRKRLSDADDSTAKKVKSEKGKGKARAMDIDDDELDEEDLDERGIEQVVPSTKMKEAGDVLDAVYDDDDPAQKTLIFCTFVEMLELMAVFLERRGIPYIMYTGKLKQDDRADAVARFNDTKNPRGPRVMLISMKCGGVGLNLTAANNVICLDMAWSPAAELQAIDRAHRIGQTRPVSVKRMVIKNSVDERILALQEKKQALADGALGEGSGGKLGRLTAQELV